MGNFKEFTKEDYIYYQAYLEGIDESYSWEFLRLAQIIEQNELELLWEQEEHCYRLVYIMNDAVESFLRFENGRMTGTYLPDYEGEVTAAIKREDAGYGLIIWQGDTICTLFFDALTLENHLFNYGQVGHFWRKGDEYMRVLNYHIQILDDKAFYLGKEVLSPMEERLVRLMGFPPLLNLFYPYASEQYLVHWDEPWALTEEAVECMLEYCERLQDHSMYRMIKYYQRHANWKWLAREIARSLRMRKHIRIVEQMYDDFKEATKEYPTRSFGREQDAKLKQSLDKANTLCQEYQKKGIKAEVLWEEPFLTAQDSVDFGVYLMIYKDGIRYRRCEIRRVS